MRAMRIPWLVSLFLLLVAVAAPASAAGARQRAKLDEIQAAYASALRWSDYESAWQLVDPEVRAQRPLTGLELERYRQLQISSYREGGSGVLDDGTVVRAVEVGVINRHTQSERVIRYEERWRWDPEAKRWWQMAGLPDFWDGL